MPYKATVKSGVTNLIVGGRGPFDAGDVILLSDDDYIAIRPSAFASLFTGSPTAVNTTTGDPYA